MSDIDSKSLDEFFSTALKLAEKGIQGQKVLTAAKGGVVESAKFFRQPDDVYDERLHQFAREAIFSIWNQDKRDAKLSEIFAIVNKKISEDIEAGEWPKIWHLPSKRTVDRRTNELAFNDSRYWPHWNFPPCICISPGRYRPNPQLFDEKTIERIIQAGEL